MTLNRDQPGIETKSSDRRSPLLPLLVAIGAFLMILLIVVLASLFFRELWPHILPESAPQQLTNVTQSPSTIDQGVNSGSQSTATTTPIHKNGQETILATPSQESETSLQPKQMLVDPSSNRPRWTATPLPTNTPTPTPSPIPTFVSDEDYSGLLRPESVSAGEKWIDVNLTSQTLVAFEGAAPVFQSLVSSGTKNHPTVTGQFRIWLRFSEQDMDGRRLGYDYNLKDVPYVQYFYHDYALHGTYWHSNFGTPMSHGCVNLPTPSAEWIFNWADYGTLVNIHK